MQSEKWVTVASCRRRYDGIDRPCHRAGTKGWIRVHQMYWRIKPRKGGGGGGSQLISKDGGERSRFRIWSGEAEGRFGNFKECWQRNFCVERAKRECDAWILILIRGQRSILFLGTCTYIRTHARPPPPPLPHATPHTHSNAAHPHTHTQHNS